MKMIVVFNREEILRAGFLASAPAFLKRVNVELIDNTQNQYPSMAEAVRTVIQRSSPDEIIVFAHQDVIFYDPDSLNIILRNVNAIRSNLYYAGAVGVKSMSEKLDNYGVNCIISGGKLLPFSKIDRPTPVETIDECVIITNVNTIVKYNLLNDTKLGWHLYAVDSSLAMAQNGQNTFVLPLPVNHLSRGHCDPQYFTLGHYLLKKYNLKVINTTNGPLTRWKVFTRRWKSIVKSNLKLT